MSLTYGISAFTSITYKDAFGGFQIVNSQWEHFLTIINKNLHIKAED